MPAHRLASSPGHASWRVDETEDSSEAQGAAEVREIERGRKGRERCKCEEI